MPLRRSNGLTRYYVKVVQGLVMRGDIKSAEDIGYAVRDIRLKHNL